MIKVFIMWYACKSRLKALQSLITNGNSLIIFSDHPNFFDHQKGFPSFYSTISHTVEKFQLKKYIWTEQKVKRGILRERHDRFKTGFMAAAFDF